MDASGSIYTDTMGRIVSQKCTIKTLILSCLLTVCIPAVSLAQDSLPSINSLNESGDIQLPLSALKHDFGSQNLYLEDTLQLQYQISLLERMVERQANIARLEKNYTDLGLAFEQPIPPYGICNNIPANVPCFRAYPELYDVILPQYTQIDVLDQQPITVEAPAPVVQPEQQVTKEEPEPEMLTTSYLWVEILCGGGVCSAVLIKNSDMEFRRTVQEGDVLEDGAIQVLTISSEGVKVLEAGKEADITPALSPGQGGPASPFLDNTASYSEDYYEENSGGELFRSVLDSDADLSELSVIENESVTLPQDNEPIQDPGSPLGPTGLF